MKRVAFWAVCTLAQGLAGPLWQHALFLEPNAESLQVTEVFRCENDSRVATSDGVRVYVPPTAIQTVETMVEEPGAAPARTSLGQTADPDVYSLTHRLRPGTTTFQVRYVIAASTKFTTRIFGRMQARLVSSPGVTLSGDKVRFVSVELQSQANLYELVNVASGELFEVGIEGSSEARPPGRQPVRGPARIFGKLTLVLGLAVSLLCICGVLLYRKASSKQTIFDRGLLISFAGILLVLVQITKGAVEPRFAVIGKTAPSFSIQTDDGRELRRDSFEGKLLVLNFWATWCQPCVMEMPSLKQFANEMEREGVMVAAVSIDENERSYRAFLSQLQPGFLTSRDAAGDLASEFGTFQVPETYVIDRTGRVLQKYINARDWMDPAIRNEMRKFLGSTK